MAKSLNDPDPRRLFGPRWYGEQNEDGIDLSVIRANLKLTPTQRIRRANAAQRDMIRLRQNANQVIEADDTKLLAADVGREKDRDSLRHLRAIKQIRQQQVGD